MKRYSRPIQLIQAITEIDNAGGLMNDGENIVLSCNADVTEKTKAYNDNDGKFTYFNSFRFMFYAPTDTEIKNTMFLRMDSKDFTIKSSMWDDMNLKLILTCEKSVN